MRGATVGVFAIFIDINKFQPTRPLRGATPRPQHSVRESLIFQPTRPLRGATDTTIGIILTAVKFQPTRPLRGATHRSTDYYHTGCISTHAPLAGRDGWKHRYQQKADQFQPTRPLRGATNRSAISIHGRKFQPTRPLRGATLSVSKLATLKRISTHAPLAGRDYRFCNNRQIILNFNPRAPCGARLLISIIPIRWLNFNPRAPCGARRQVVDPYSPQAKFQPTRPLRGATEIIIVLGATFVISTHAPLAGRDREADALLSAP